jgi:hypothetical protein
MELETLIWLFGHSYQREQETIEAEEKQKQKTECYSD